MPLSAKQVAELEKPLDAKNVATRKQSGRVLSYIEGWHAISEANRIFGFDGWQRQTVEMREVRAPELVKTDRSTTWRVGYLCKVRVTVGDIVREGTGFGSGALPDLGEAIESAVKEAETDAMKRALMTFGNTFGLALYDKEQANVAHGDDEAKARIREKPAEANPFAAGSPEQTAQDCDEITRLIGAAKNMEELKQLWKTPWIRAFMSSAPEGFSKPLQTAMGKRKRELAEPGLEAA